MSAAALTLKDPAREVALLRSRAVVALCVCLLILLGLLGRLIWLQVYSHDHYQTLSRDNRVSLGPVAPPRGLILDRNGVLLADNRPSFGLEIIPENVDDMAATLDLLATVVTLEDSDLTRFERELKQHRRFEAVPLRPRLDEAEVARFSVNRHRFPGVRIRAELTRHYPLGELTAHLVGYVGRINEKELKRVDGANYSGTSYIGKVGVEHFYEDTLHGKVGRRWVERNARGRELRELRRVQPSPGRDLHLYLDSRLQQAAADALGDERGSVIAIDPETGGILAFVSMPTYDPNLFVRGISTRAYGRLRNNPGRPLFNRALRGQYPPGSTIKPFIALAGLETEVMSPGDTTWCPGYMTLPNKKHRYRCWKHIGHGHMNMKDAITQSCDVYFYDLARDLGIDRLHSYLGHFGFGRDTGVDLSGERGGLLPSRAWKRRARKQPWYPGETLITGIGQGFFLATPLQLAHATAVLVTHGKNHIPRAVATIEDRDLDLNAPLTSVEPVPVPIRQINNWNLALAAMRNVVHGARGTARHIGTDAIFGIGGKTGTAQVFGIKQGEKYDKKNTPKHLRDHALFIAYAPVDAPAIVVAVIVENGGSGSKMAAPIARKVIDAWLLGDASA